MSVNRYPATCAVCKAPVPARGGVLRKEGPLWTVRHLVCDGTGEPEVSVTQIGDWVGTRNRRGICEDAPCCGCCTF